MDCTGGGSPTSSGATTGLLGAAGSAPGRWRAPGRTATMKSVRAPGPAAGGHFPENSVSPVGSQRPTRGGGQSPLPGGGPPGRGAQLPSPTVFHLDLLGAPRKTCSLRPGLEGERLAGVLLCGLEKPPQDSCGASPAAAAASAWLLPVEGFGRLPRLPSLSLPICSVALCYPLGQSHQSL